MDAADVIAVIGACGPERRRLAHRLAEQTGRTLLIAAAGDDPADLAHDAVRRGGRGDPAGVVLELPDEIPATELIGAFADASARTRLRELICVADAAHLLDDLHREDHVPLREAHPDEPVRLEARAQLTVTQLEYASTILLVNWAALPWAELSLLMALLSHLSPRARLRLQHDDAEHSGPGRSHPAEQDRPGWACVLNGEFDPHMTDPRVSALRHEQVRPLHPERLRRLLDERIEPGEFGRVVRSAGFCRLATRPGVVAHWEHVGRVISLTPLAADADLSGDEELLALGQDLAFIGIDLDHGRLRDALDDAALTDEELAAGPAAWAAWTDPFPAWTTATRSSE